MARVDPRVKEENRHTAGFGIIFLLQTVFLEGTLPFFDHQKASILLLLLKGPFCSSKEVDHPLPMTPLFCQELASNAKARQETRRAEGV